MKTIEVSESLFDCIIESLESSIHVCYEVDSTSDNSERSYPYATGYSRECMKHVVETMKRIKAEQ